MKERADNMEYSHGKYSGEVAKGMPHGQGKILYRDGSYYEGGWENGSYHGYGRSVHMDWGEFRGSYEGQWEKGRLKQGKYIAPDESVYEGQFKGGYLHGFGKRKWYAGSYEGQWENGYMHGKGRRCYYGGSVWEGEWKENRVYGRGTFTSQKGWVFTGEYFDIPQNSHGKGIIVFPNGDRYEGEVGADYSAESLDMHGKGTYTYADGRVHSDEFSHGKSRADRHAEWEAKRAEEKRLELQCLEAKKREEEERAKDPAAYDAARRAERKTRLENACKALYGSETDIGKRYSILKEAYYQAHNSGFNDHMAWEASRGRSDSQIEFWQNACRLKYEVEALCDIYKEELGE